MVKDYVSGPGADKFRNRQRTQALAGFKPFGRKPVIKKELVSKKKLEPETPDVVPFNSLPILQALNPGDYVRVQRYVTKVLAPDESYQKVVEEIIIGALSTLRSDMVKPGKDYLRHERSFLEKQVREYRNTMGVLEITCKYMPDFRRKQLQNLRTDPTEKESNLVKEVLLAHFINTQHYRFIGLDQLAIDLIHPDVPVNNTHDIILLSDLSDLITDDVFEAHSQRMLDKKYTKEFELYKPIVYNQGHSPEVIAEMERIITKELLFVYKNIYNHQDRGLN